MQEVGPGGHFFGAEHTQSRYKTAFHKPMLSDWRNYETWEEAGLAGGPGEGQPDLEGAARRVRAAADGPGDPRGARGVRRPARRRGRRPDRLLRGSDPLKQRDPGRRHRWRRGRRQRPVPPDEGGLDRRHAARAARADRRLHLARGRRHAHAQRRPERGPAPAVHDPAVRGDRAGLRPGLLHPPAGRPDAGRHRGPDGLPADGRQARGRYLGMDLELITPKEAAGRLPAAGPAVLRRGAVRPGRGPRRPDRGHARLREVRPAGRRRGPPAHAGRRARAARRTAPGTSASRAATRSTPSTSSTPAGCGRARSAGWSASSCRSWRWSTCTC